MHNATTLKSVYSYGYKLVPIFIKQNWLKTLDHVNEISEPEVSNKTD